MSGGEVVQFPPRPHAEHPGIFWAGDRDEAWCSACGAPWIMLGESCDWGDCDDASVGIRFDPDSSRYLPVCAQHFDGYPATTD